MPAVYASVGACGSGRPGILARSRYPAACLQLPPRNGHNPEGRRCRASGAARPLGVAVRAVRSGDLGVLAGHRLRELWPPSRRRSRTARGRLGAPAAAPRLAARALRSASLCRGDVAEAVNECQQSGWRAVRRLLPSTTSLARHRRSSWCYRIPSRCGPSLSADSVGGTRVRRVVQHVAQPARRSEATSGDGTGRRVVPLSGGAHPVRGSPGCSTTSSVGRRTAIRGGGPGSAAPDSRCSAATPIPAACG